MAGIEVDQKLLWRRFQVLINQSRVRQAAMNGDRALERQLRRQTGRRRREVGTTGCDYDSAWNLERILGGDCFREQMAEFRPRDSSATPSQSLNLRGGQIRRKTFTAPQISSCKSRLASDRSPSNVFHLTAVDTDCDDQPTEPKVDSTEGRSMKRTKTRLNQKESEDKSENDLLGKSLAQMTIDRSHLRRRQFPKHRSGTAKVRGRGGGGRVGEGEGGGGTAIPSLVDIQLRIIREVSTEQLKRVNVFCSQLDAAAHRDSARLRMGSI